MSSQSKIIVNVFCFQHDRFKVFGFGAPSGFWRTFRSLSRVRSSNRFTTSITKIVIQNKFEMYGIRAFPSWSCHWSDLQFELRRSRHGMEPLSLLPACLVTNRVVPLLPASTKGRLLLGIWGLSLWLWRVMTGMTVLTRYDGVRFKWRRKKRIERRWSIIGVYASQWSPYKLLNSR